MEQCYQKYGKGMIHMRKTQTSTQLQSLEYASDMHALQRNTPG